MKRIRLVCQGNPRFGYEWKCPYCDATNRVMEKKNNVVICWCCDRSCRPTPKTKHNSKLDRIRAALDAAEVKKWNARGY